MPPKDTQLGGCSEISDGHSVLSRPAQSHAHGLYGWDAMVWGWWVSVWICLRCDWTGGGGGGPCPRCGVALYRRQPPAPHAGPSPGGQSDPTTAPTIVTGRRWVVLTVVVGLVTALGVGNRLVRPDADDGALSLGSGGDRVSAGEPQVVGMPESSVGHGSLRTSAEFIEDAVAICDAATTRFREATAGLGYPVDQVAWDAAAIRYSRGALAELRALTLPKMKGQRARFGEYQSILRREIDALRNLASAVATGHTARAHELAAELTHLIHVKEEREPELRSCPVALGE